MGKGDGTFGPRLRDARPRPYLYFLFGAFFLCGGSFVTLLLFVAKRDPQTSILNYAIPLLPTIACFYFAWGSFRDAVAALRSRFTLFEGGFELLRPGYSVSAPWRDVVRVELRASHLIGVAVTIRVVVLRLRDGRTVELPRMTPRPEELAWEIEDHVARSR